MSRTESVSIPSIKYFGTSWYKRGAAYWFKRFWLTFGALWFIVAFLLAFSLLVSVLFDHIKSAQGRGIVLTVLAVLIFVNLYSAYLQMKRSPDERAAHKPLTFKSRANNAKVKLDARTAGTAGTAAGILGGGPIAVLATPLMAGVAFGFFFITLGKYVKEEEWLLAQKFGIERSKAAP
jgi:protein-S-isoprenylcysteine O-methyltransferase Ste14